MLLQLTAEGAPAPETDACGSSKRTKVARATFATGRKASHVLQMFFPAEPEVSNFNGLGGGCARIRTLDPLIKSLRFRAAASRRYPTELRACKDLYPPLADNARRNTRYHGS
jgi:hypothetical protein